MNCRACERKSGTYDFNCPECCARLVSSARPSKGHAKGLLAAIERFPQCPARDAILEKIKNEKF